MAGAAILVSGVPLAQRSLILGLIFNASTSLVLLSPPRKQALACVTWSTFGSDFTSVPFVASLCVHLHTCILRMGVLYLRHPLGWFERGLKGTPRTPVELARPRS